MDVWFRFRIKLRCHVDESHSNATSQYDRRNSRNLRWASFEHNLGRSMLIKHLLPLSPRFQLTKMFSLMNSIFQHSFCLSKFQSAFINLPVNIIIDRIIVFMKTIVNQPLRTEYESCTAVALRFTMKNIQNFDQYTKPSRNGVSMLTWRMHC